MTHKELVDVAYKWILKGGQMTVAFKELRSFASEIPDVIGFNSGESMMVECKASRSDFLADKKKKHRDKGMGKWRFYCCPVGLIKPEEVPDKWGLIYVNPDGKARVEKECRWKHVRVENKNEWDDRAYPEGFHRRKEHTFENCFEFNTHAERQVMFTVIRRLFLRGLCKYVYDKDIRVIA